VFFSLSLEFCSCGCFFWGILNVLVVGDSELEEASCEHLRRILQEENNSGVLLTTADGNSCCFLPCLSQISAVVGVFFFAF
jgi:hypothetical protein